MIDVSTFRLGEIARIEELSGQPITSLADEEMPKGKALAALAFVAKRREDSKFTWNEALDLSMEEVQELLGLNDEDDESESDPTQETEESPED